MGYKICQDLVTSYLFQSSPFLPLAVSTLPKFLSWLFEMTLSVVSFALMAMDSNLPSVWKILPHLLILPISA